MMKDLTAAGLAAFRPQQYVRTEYTTLKWKPVRQIPSHVTNTRFSTRTGKNKY